MDEQKRQEELQALKREVFATLHCALPGIVEAFDAETRTAVIRPAVKRGMEAGDPALSLPLLRDVPVFMPVPFEVSPGDACLVVFADCDIDAWFESGEAEAPPSGRMHSLSDGFAFVGFRTMNEEGSETDADQA